MFGVVFEPRDYLFLFFFSPFILLAFLGALLWLNRIIEIIEAAKKRKINHCS